MPSGFSILHTMELQSLRRRDVLLASLACLTASVYPGPQAALAAPDNATEQLVHDAANRFLDVMRNGAPREEVTETLNRYVAMGSIALFVLGKHRRHLKPGQQQRYISLFEDMVLNTVAKYGKKIRGNAFVVKDSQRNIVRGHIQHDNDRRTELEFRTRQGRITDVRVAGFWMSILLRQSFDYIISQGGNIDAIFVYLKSGRLPL